MKKLSVCVMAMLVVAVFSSVVFAESSKDQAVALVKKAEAYLKANGKDKAFAEISNPKGQFIKGELYLFVQDFNGAMLAHGSNPKLAGKNLVNLKDPDGKFFVQEMIKTAKHGSGWVDYKWNNPVTKKIEAKTSYIQPVGDIFIGCGIYK